jgi:arogenate dehydrogenase (NADP+)
MLDVSKIGVVGAGLIGGSLLKSLQKADNYEVYAVSHSQSTIDKILNQNLACQVSLDFEILKDCDVVFVTVPMNKIIETIKKVSEIVKDTCIITDAGSLKGFVLEYINNNQSPIRFVGGHPMAGTEKKGIDAAQENLFEDTKWVLIPSKWVCEQEINVLEQIVAKVGAKTIITNAYQHDKAAALISHMPMLLSQSLFAAVENCPDKNIQELALQLASSGFRDMTRLAMTNPEMAKDMIANNNTNIIESIKAVQSEAEKLVDVEYFDSVIEDIVKKRSDMYSEEGKNQF